MSPGVTVSVRLCAVPARVFKLKKQQMLDEICKDGIFGECPARVWTIEYQKRGLPHLHLLVFLKDSEHFLEPEVIDEMVMCRASGPLLGPLRGAEGDRHIADDPWPLWSLCVSVCRRGV